MKHKAINASFKWRFTINAKNKKGKVCRDHIENVVGPDYTTARIHLDVRLERKGWSLLTIAKVYPRE